jgi:hypothetical protein
MEDNDLKERFEMFNNSPGSKWNKVDISEEKPKKPLKTKSKRVLSQNPAHNKDYRK